MRFVLFVLILYHVEGYLQESYAPAFYPSTTLSVDACSVYTEANATRLHFYAKGIDDIVTGRTSNVHVINNDCTLMLFGYPSENKVVMWRPFEQNETTVEPDFNVPVHRFGFSLDIQDTSWVVGAPGLPNNYTGQGATMGYVFMYKDDAYHSCHSLFDTYCYPIGEECVTGFKHMKDAYNLTDAAVPAFQKQCRTRDNAFVEIPRYNSVELIESQVEYFVYQQFGYDVSLSGPLGQWGSTLFVSAPGDTNRFMEDNDGANYGRVYVWDSYMWDPQDESLPTITWWQPSVMTPLMPPAMAGVTYRAFGRAIASSRATLAVAMYPLYDATAEPFIIIYHCSKSLTTFSNCVESPERGISINALSAQLRRNVLGYMTNAMFAYSDGKTQMSYIPAAHFQNEFIGRVVGVIGSNVMIPDYHNSRVYRFGRDSEPRETLETDINVTFGTNTQHWLFYNTKLVHQWNCPLGRVGPRFKCNPCQISYYSDDGWLEYCDVCPVNFTTNETGQSVCIAWSPPIPPGLLWSDAIFIMAVILISVTACYCLFVGCQFSSRRKRVFNDNTNF